MVRKYIEKLKILVSTGFFHVFGSSVVNKIIAFLSNIVLVRILTKVEYGVFTYAWNIYSIVLLVNGLGLESGTLQLCSERSGELDFAKKITSYGVRIGIFFDFLLALFILGLGILAPLTIGDAGKLLQLLCLLPIFQFLYNLSTMYLRSQKKNKEYSKLTVLNTILIFGFSAAEWFLGIILLI